MSLDKTKLTESRIESSAISTCIEWSKDDAYTRSDEATATKVRESKWIYRGDRDRSISDERRESNAARNPHRATGNETKMTDRPIRWNTSTHENAAYTIDDRRFSLATNKREGQKPKTDYI